MYIYIYIYIYIHIHIYTYTYCRTCKLSHVKTLPSSLNVQFAELVPHLLRPSQGVAV